MIDFMRARDLLVVGVSFVGFGSVACQGVQPGSTLDPPITQTGSSSASQSDTVEGTGLDVRLETVEQQRPEIALAPRNPFRFGGTAVDVPVELELEAPVGETETDGAPRVVAVAPRIPLRMIGLVEAPDDTGRIAVLTDGDVVLQGREGDVVDGRYRILSIGPTSMEIESIEHGNRQVLRLAGS